MTATKPSLPPRTYTPLEYFSNGPMSKQPNRFKGQVLEALRAVRPVVVVETVPNSFHAHRLFATPR